MSLPFLCDFINIYRNIRIIKPIYTLVFFLFQSSGQIYLKIITTLVDIFEEVLQIKHITYEKTLHEIITILTIEDRMIYFGIFLIILSLFFFIIY